MSYTSDVISATSGRGEPNWDLIIKLCNRIRDSVGSVSMQQAMSSVLTRVKHSDPNVQLHALTLLEACVSNCGKDFQLELTKPSFQSDIKGILTSSYSDPRVTQRIKELLVNWVNEFRNNSNMSSLARFVEQLKKDGISFPGLRQQTTPSSSNLSGTSTVLQTREDDDLRRAIQLSLQEPTASGPSSSPLYPSIGSTAPIATTSATKASVKKVRAIYDFVAAEDNELSFRAGEVISVLDSSDENWWKGETQLGTGLFPASFVSTDLSVNPEPSHVEKKESNQAAKAKDGDKSSVAKTSMGVNEGQIDLLLDMIKTADVTSEENQAENATLLELEDQCKKMRPVVKERIAALQIQEDEMQTVSDKFQEALQIYRKLLSEGPRLSSSVPSVVQPDATKQPPTSVAEVSQPPPYHHPPYHHPPSHPAPPTSSGLLSSSPQQSLYGAATSDYTIQQGHPPPHLSGPGHMTSHPGPVPMASLTSSQPPWSHGQQQPSLSVYSGTSFPQQSISMPPQSLSAHRPGYSIAGAPPVSAMPKQAPAPPPYQPASLYQPQQALVQQPLL